MNIDNKSMSGRRRSTIAYSYMLHIFMDIVIHYHVESVIVTGCIFIYLCEILCKNRYLMYGMSKLIYHKRKFSNNFQ